MLDQFKEKLKRLGPYFIPDYQRWCIANLPELMEAHFLGRRRTRLKEVKEFLKGTERVALLVVDGLGLKLVLKALQEPRHPLKALLRKGRLWPMTSVFPSTTSTALTSLCTGLQPQEHAILGYTMYLKEYGVVANMIEFSPAIEGRHDVLLELGLDPKAFLGAQTLFERLEGERVEAHVLTRRIYKNSALSRMLHYGATMHTYLSSSDLALQLARLMRGEGEGFIFAYWDLVDSIGHAYGPEGEEVLAEVRTFFSALKEGLLPRLEGKDYGSVLLITADHGLAPLTGEGILVASQEPKLLAALRIPPTGDSRASFLSIKEGREEEVKEVVEGRLKGDVLILSSDQALKLGLLGTSRPREVLEDRMGELLALPGRGKGIILPYRRREKDTELRGAHGGLTDDELLVPLLGYAPGRS